MLNFCENNLIKYCFFLFIIFLNNKIYCQVHLGTINIKQTPVEFTLDSKGFILYGISKSDINPFYHYSAIADNNIKAIINNASELRLKLVNEVWSFSKPYQIGEYYQNYLWAKPSIFLKTKEPLRLFNKKFIDTISILAGDLWRQKDADGLLLDDFESQGAIINVNFLKKFLFNWKIIGAGWTQFDDYRSFKLGYSDLASVTYVYNFLNGSNNINDAKILNLGIHHCLNNFNIKADIAKNFTTNKIAALLGMEYFFSENKLNFTLDIEYRHYEDHFFFLRENFLFPYFNSMTGLDKKINNFQLYQLYQNTQNALALLLNGNYSLNEKMFLQFYIETILGSNIIQNDNRQEKYAYELNAGISFNKIIRCKLGIGNKFFRLSNEYSTMFELKKNPWFFGKLEFNL
jgi:hypothetical protein